MSALVNMGKSRLILQQKPSDAQGYYTRALQLLQGMKDTGKQLSLELQARYGQGKFK